MRRVVCFDLDGTLLPMNTGAFVQTYMESITPHMMEVAPPKHLYQSVMDAFKQMVKSTDGVKTNAEVFWHHFLPAIGKDEAEILPIFEQYYADHFPKLKRYVEPNPLSRQIVQTLIERGYDVVVATNPVFPRIAIEERLQWAGVYDLPLNMVTFSEETHYCKPNPQYYQEIVDRLGVKAEDCMMIGNDVQEDLVAQTLGMKTYLVTDCLIDRGTPQYQPDEQGSLEDLWKMIHTDKRWLEVD
ncbi:HAD family hydrolase [Mechercharimyces sp. CAU 1602]|uniref:HAD family hydrolase n=1 Tax=Mechercharimyces sp. CAU 1602 TaxID=2973933 RepID=UPI002163FC3E|nr:HAD family hydrolase [Mechercharimyces sp. CAU 1602]MCS1351709.1 HAD family hydrolase [Mechercharimyces sp. CAU 1602]